MKAGEEEEPTQEEEAQLQAQEDQKHLETLRIAHETPIANPTNKTITTDCNDK